MTENSEKEGEPTVNSGDGDKPEAPSWLGQMDDKLKRLEEANAKSESLIKQQAELYARQRIGGETQGGTVEETKKELTPTEYKDQVLSGKLYQNG